MRRATRDNVDRRLARVEGQVRALRRMVGEDRYCVDIARQVQAARAALSSLESIILDAVSYTHLTLPTSDLV